MKFSTWAASVLLAVGAAADSNLDWYEPKASVSALVCRIPGEDTNTYCDDWAPDFIDRVTDMLIAQCKDTSCSGAFTYFEFDFSIDAIFIPSARDEFDTQLRNIMHKMAEVEPDSFGFAATVTWPGTMILNRFDNEAEQGAMTINVAQDTGNGMCDVLQKIGAAGSVLPEVGPFFGLIGIADC